MEIEPNQEQTIPAETETQRTFDTFFFIALEDLDCSTILYHRGHYAQSVFYLQQAVEKAVKSMGLHFGLINEEDLQRKVSHNSLEVYKKPANTFADDVVSLNKELDTHPEFKNIMNLSGTDFDEFASDMKKAKHEWSKYIGDVAKYNFTTEELQELITKIDEINADIENANTKICEESISDEDFAAAKEELRNYVETAFQQSTIPDDLKEKMVKELQSVFSTQFPNKDVFEYVSYLSINATGIGLNLFYLSVITSLHASKARYPEKDFNPLTFYTTECPLIERMPEIQNITRQTLERMDEMYDLMMNPPIEPPSASEPPNLMIEESGGEIQNEQ